MNSIIHQRNDLLTVDEAVDRVQRIHPNLSKAACAQVVRFAQNR